MYPKQLLTFDNAKTIKSLKLNIKTYILYMSSGRQNAKGVNLCSHASEGCLNACLFKSGFGGFFSHVENSRIAKSNYYLSNRKAFLLQLVSEIEKIVEKSKKENYSIAIRLNGTTDIAWEKFKIVDDKNIFEIFPEVVFYDYTKNPNRFFKELPKNYSLTFSRSETNHAWVERVLSRGGNVAIVFDELPTTYMGYDVINGDESDARFLDKKNVIVGLKYKRLTMKNANNNIERFNNFVIKSSEILEIKKAS